MLPDSRSAPAVLTSGICVPTPGVNDWTQAAISRVWMRSKRGGLRMAWALALGGMQDVGQNGPESELNPLIDNGFMYTSDGWGTIYKIDARDGNRGQFVWVTDPGVKHQGHTSRTRGVALWEDLVIANLPDGRVIGVKRDNGEILWDKMVAATNEFGNREFFDTAPMTVEDKVLIANGAGDAGTRGWVAALEARTGKELWRLGGSSKITAPTPVFAADIILVASDVAA